MLDWASRANHLENGKLNDGRTTFDGTAMQSRRLLERFVIRNHPTQFPPKWAKGDLSPTSQMWPNGSVNPPCRCVPQGVT
jgi:hypothetical protein